MNGLSVDEKIVYARAYTYEHQYNLLLGLAAKMSEEPFRLLVSHLLIDHVFHMSFSNEKGKGVMNPVWIFR